MQYNFRLRFYLSFLQLKSRNSSLSFVRLNWNRIKDDFAINWQNFAQVRLQLKFAFRIRPIVNAAVFMR